MLFDQPLEEFCEHNGHNFVNIPGRSVHKTTKNRIRVEPAWHSSQVERVGLHKFLTMSSERTGTIGTHAERSGLGGCLTGRTR